MDQGMITPRSFSLPGIISLLLTSFCAAASAIVIVSPGDSGGSGALRNGGFEEATDTPWVRNTTNTNIVITTDAANAYQGSKYLTVEKLFVSPFWTNAAQNTAYTIQAGDRFELSFYAKAMNGAATGNTMSWTLFYTSDNTLTGVRSTVASGFTAALTTSYALTSFSMESEVAAGAVGRNLFILVASDNLSNNAVVAVDNITLATVPEPGAAGLLALGLGSFLVSRRRRA